MGKQPVCPWITLAAAAASSSHWRLGKDGNTQTDGTRAGIIAVMRGTAAMTTRAADGTEVPGTADQRREQMLHAALEVISARGYADTRIADVAERAGVSPALVIYYFKTKDQLLTEAIRHYEDAWYAVGQQRMAGLAIGRRRASRSIVAMSCLTEADPEPASSWQLWLDFWAQAARNAGGRERPAEVRRALARDHRRPRPRGPGGGRVPRNRRRRTSRSTCRRCWTGSRSRSPWMIR